PIWLRGILPDPAASSRIRFAIFDVAATPRRVKCDAKANPTARLQAVAATQVTPASPAGAASTADESAAPTAVPDDCPQCAEIRRAYAPLRSSPRLFPARAP